MPGKVQTTAMKTAITLTAWCGLDLIHAYHCSQKEWTFLGD